MVLGFRKPFVKTDQQYEESTECRHCLKEFYVDEGYHGYCSKSCYRYDVE